jgi:hypothetical protein
MQRRNGCIVVEFVAAPYSKTLTAFLRASNPTVKKSTYARAGNSNAMHDELFYWLDGFLSALWYLCSGNPSAAADPPAPLAPVNNELVPDFPHRRIVSCQKCKKRLWSNYTGVAYPSTPYPSAAPPLPPPKEGDWSHEYLDRYGKRVFSDVCEQCLRELRAQR